MVRAADDLVMPAAQEPAGVCGNARQTVLQTEFRTERQQSGRASGMPLMTWTRPVRRRLVLSGLLAALLAISACRSPHASQADAASNQRRPLEIWWSQGYYPEETDAIELIVQQWRRQTGQPVRLSLFSENEILAKADAISRGGPAPDVLYGYGINDTSAPRLAYLGQLVAVDDVIESIRKDLLPGIHESIVYLNKQTGRRAAYAVPISRHSVAIHFWRDLLNEQKPGAVESTGRTLDRAIPSDWNQFWAFWQQQQRRLHVLGYKDIYGLGLPMSTQARDTTYVFEYFLEAYNVKVYDRNGRLTIRRHRDGLIQALRDYTNHYRNRFVPPTSRRWADADNNVNFLSSQSLMTINPTLSIPGSQIADDIAYKERLGSLPWPRKPNGSPLPSSLFVKQLVVFDRGKIGTAKSFVTFLLRPGHLSKFVEGSQGRFLPVVRQIDAMPFWQNPDDPHIRIGRASLRNPRLPTFLLNPAYSEVVSRNVWSTAVEQVAGGEVSAEKAADEAIEAIEKIDRGWK